MYRVEGNLRVRQLDGTGDRALTTDGDAGHDYGANPDYLMYSTLLTKLGLPHLPPAIAGPPTAAGSSPTAPCRPAFGPRT